MRFSDLFLMGLTNLWRRKLRTVLTVLGVIIGTASIVVMLSLGFGLTKSTTEQIEKSGGLTTINVYEGYSGNSSGNEDEINGLTDSVVEQIAAIEHVVCASPVLNFSVLARQGAYECNMTLIGMTTDALKAMKLPISEGEIPTEGEDLKFIYGNQVLMDFYNTKTDEGYWDTGVMPDVDLMGKPLFVIFDMDAYYNSQSGDGTIPKKYMIDGAALIEGSEEDYNEYSWNVYVDIDALKAQLKKTFKSKAIPGQPTTKSGKPYKEYQYNQVYVQVDEMSNVTDVQKKIVDMGFEASSNAEYLQTMQKQYRSIQAVLGGIGAVSMFVAAISIANTMMMSIYERTKEIGVMKVLGCGLGNIRSMFLTEAGFIGLIGGILGVLLSYLISAVINTFLTSAYGYEAGETISYIPLWLPALSIVFAVLVGMIAGYFPAKRAMKLSPLAAIRNE